MLSLHYQDGGVQRSLSLTIDSLKDLRAIFKRFIGVIKPEIDEIFRAQGPGWTPLAESTKEARDQRLAGGLESKIRAGALQGLSRKLSREQERATRRLETRQGPVGPKALKLLASAQRAVDRQQRVRAEFDRLRSGGDASFFGASKDKQRKLYERVGRAVQRSEAKIDRLKSGALLGGIANSISYEIKDGGLEIFSRVAWAGVHNDGGTVGHGARLPARKFLEWTPQRIETLAKVAERYMLDRLA